MIFPKFSGLGGPPFHRKADQWPVRLAPSHEVPEGSSPRGILIQIAGNSLATEGLIFRWQGTLVAYINQCRHWPVLLDFGDGDFLAPNQQFLQCRHHGALYDPLSGRCVAGPCEGARLTSLIVEESDGWILIHEPAGLHLDS